MKKITPLFILLIVFACSSDTELKKSVYIPDTEFPELPKYSEWGYNTFGAYYDRQVFTSTYRDVPVKIINKDGNTSLVFAGQKGADYSNYPFSLTLTIADFNPTTYQDLKELDNTTLDLTDSNYEIVFNDGITTSNAQVISGQFKFNRAQNLLVDKQETEVILSGTFDFQVLINELPYTISNGRFDVGVDRDNFYKY